MRDRQKHYSAVIILATMLQAFSCADKEPMPSGRSPKDLAAKPGSVDPIPVVPALEAVELANLDSAALPPSKFVLGKTALPAAEKVAVEPQLIVEQGQIALSRNSSTVDESTANEIRIAISENIEGSAPCILESGSHQLLLAPEELTEITLLPNKLYQYSICAPASEEKALVDEVIAIGTLYSPAEPPTVKDIVIDQKEREVSVRIETNNNPSETSYVIVTASLESSATALETSIEGVGETNTQASEPVSLTLTAKLPNSGMASPEQFQVIAINRDGAPSAPSGAAAVPIEALQSEFKKKVAEAISQDQEESNLQEPEGPEEFEPLDVLEAKIEALADGYGKIIEAMSEMKAEIVKLNIAEEKLTDDIRGLEKISESMSEKMRPTSVLLAKKESEIEALRERKKSSSDQKQRTKIATEMLSAQEEMAVLQDSLSHSTKGMEINSDHINRLREKLDNIKANRAHLREQLSSMNRSREALRRYGNSAKSAIRR